VKAGWIGLGKLGYPCALALAAHGHEVYGYDIAVHGPRHDLCEEDLEKTRAAAGDRMHYMQSVAQVVDAASIVVIAVQTPHIPGYGGEAPAPPQPRDFEYAHLVGAVREVMAAAGRKPFTLVILSTTLPGTVGRLIRPLVTPWARLVYSPAFISLGTTIRDFSHPDYIICGSDYGFADPALRELYEFTQAPLVPCSHATGELIKVSRNALITSHIVFANYLMEIAHGVGADVDTVTGALGLEVRAGMGDGGPCRPRDLIALSWLSQRLGLSCDVAGMTGQAREAQMGFIAGVARTHCALTGLPAVILGAAYKPGTDLVAGSPGRLLARLMGPGADVRDDPPGAAAVFVIATRQPRYAAAAWPAGSVVIDPWGYIPDQRGVTVIRVGRQ
jgi:UDPglucose 6-dehydrogenase